jgi:hypothetical protein
MVAHVLADSSLGLMAERRHVHVSLPRIPAMTLQLFSKAKAVPICLRISVMAISRIDVLQ